MKVITPLILLFFTFDIMLSQNTERDICLPKCICLPNEGFMSCHENANISIIPTNLDKSLTKLIIQKGSFDSPILGIYNLTGLEHLTFLKIIYYNLYTIVSRAFINMRRLQYLDISHNKLINIESFAFTGLTLQELHIMENVNIHFQANAFSHMTSLTINMRSNNLSYLDYNIFKQTKVKLFYLYNNKITTINPKFQILFNNSDSLLDVSNNPLKCDCSIKWLAEILTKHYLHKKSIIQSKNINITCYTPLILQNKPLMSLKEEDFKCLPLKIETIKLYFTGGFTSLTCVSKVGGNKPPIVKWFHHIDENEKIYIPGFNVIEQSQETTFQSISLTYNTINFTDNFFTSGMTKLICFASISEDFIQKLEILIYRSNPSTIYYTPNQTIIKPNLRKEKNFLFMKHFSILELMGAILGTFSVTITGLIILLRYLRSYQNKLKNKNDFVDLHKNMNSVKPYWYAPHGNESTYSMPNSHPEYENPVNFEILQDSTNVYQSYTFGRLEFLDYKTHNPIVT